MDLPPVPGCLPPPPHPAWTSAMGSEVCLWYILWGIAAVTVTTLLERLRNDRGERPLAP